MGIQTVRPSDLCTFKPSDMQTFGQSNPPTPPQTLRPTTLASRTCSGSSRSPVPPNDHNSQHNEIVVFAQQVDFAAPLLAETKAKQIQREKPTDTDWNCADLKERLGLLVVVAAAVAAATRNNNNC